MVQCYDCYRRDKSAGKVRIGLFFLAPSLSLPHNSLIELLFCRNILRSIVIAVPIITGLYVFMNMAYMTVLSADEMMTAPAVAVAFGNRVLGPFSFVIPLGVALATFGCALSIQFGVTRLCFVAGQEGHMLKLTSYIHVRRFTPGPAVVMQVIPPKEPLPPWTKLTNWRVISLQGIIAFLFMLVGNIGELIEFASFLIWFFYGCATVALLIMRKTHANVHRPYKVPLILPFITLAVSVFLSVMPMIADPSLKYLFAVAFILMGVAVYVPFVYYKKRPKMMGMIVPISHSATSSIVFLFVLQVNLRILSKCYSRLFHRKTKVSIEILTIKFINILLIIFLTVLSLFYSFFIA